METWSVIARRRPSYIAAILVSGLGELIPLNLSKHETISSESETPKLAPLLANPVKCVNPTATTTTMTNTQGTRAPTRATTVRAVTVFAGHVVDVGTTATATTTSTADETATEHATKKAN